MSCASFSVISPMLVMVSSSLLMSLNVFLPTKPNPTPLLGMTGTNSLTSSPLTSLFNSARLWAGGLKPTQILIYTGLHISVANQMFYSHGLVPPMTAMNTLITYPLLLMEYPPSPFPLFLF